MKTKGPLLAVLVAAGCSKQEKPAEPAATPAQPDDSRSVATSAVQAPAALPDVLVAVNGKQLTREAALEEVNNRLAGLRRGNNEIPADRLDTMRRRMLAHVVDQFVARSLLVAEADKRGIEPTDEEIEKAFDTIRQSLPEGMTLEAVMQNSPMGEERMRQEVLTGIRIDKLLAEVTGDLTPSDAAIDAFIEENKDNLQVPENVTARHILIATSEDDDDTVRAEKKEKAESLRQQLVDGADFAALAAEHSDCPSKQKGGNLGQFRRGQMVKPFEDAAFTQELGTIGPVVETPFGYHVVEVLERNDGGPLPREQVVDIVAGQEKQKAIRDFIESLKDKATIVNNVSG